MKICLLAGGKNGKTHLVKAFKDYDCAYKWMKENAREDFIYDFVDLEVLE